MSTLVWPQGTQVSLSPASRKTARYPVSEEAGITGPHVAEIPESGTLRILMGARMKAMLVLLVHAVNLDGRKKAKPQLCSNMRIVEKECPAVPSHRAGWRARRESKRDCCPTTGSNAVEIYTPFSRLAPHVSHRDGLQCAWESAAVQRATMLSSRDFMLPPFDEANGHGQRARIGVEA